MQQLWTNLQLRSSKELPQSSYTHSLNPPLPLISHALNPHSSSPHTLCHSTTHPQFKLPPSHLHAASCLSTMNPIGPLHAHQSRPPFILYSPPARVRPPHVFPLSNLMASPSHATLHPRLTWCNMPAIPSPTPSFLHSRIRHTIAMTTSHPLLHAASLCPSHNSSFMPEDLKPFTSPKQNYYINTILLW